MPARQLEYRRHDLRSRLDTSEFDVALSLFNSLGYGTETDDVDILTTLRAALRPGGALFVDTTHRDHVVASLSPAWEYSRPGSRQFVNRCAIANAGFALRRDWAEHRRIHGSHREMERSSFLDTRQAWRPYFVALAVPLQLAAAITLILLAVMLTLSLQARLLGLPASFVLLLCFFKYSFELLDAMVSGQTAPVLSIDTITGSVGEFRLLLPLILVVIGFFASGAARVLMGPLLAAVIAIALLPALPAVLALQGWTGRLAHSLDPRSCLTVMAALGGDYLALLGCTAALLIVCLLLPAGIPHLPSVLRIALLLYGWLALLAVTGAAIRRRRAVLEQRIPLIIAQTLPASTAQQEQARQRWLDSVYGAWRANARDNAWRLVAERVDAASDAILELQWLYEHCSSWREALFSNRVVQEIVSRLLRENREAEALRAARERLTRDPGFRVRAAEESERLAGLARRWGDQQTAKQLSVS